MASPNPILLVTDFSPNARHAAERAAWIAEETGAILILMHVIPEGRIEDLRRWLGAGRVSEATLHDEARMRLEQLAGELKATHALKIQTMHTIGHVQEEVLVQASVHGASLVVVGARGTSSLQRLVLGTTSERLLNRTTRPLLVVRRAPQERYRHVLIALDFSPWSDGLVDLATQIAPTAHIVLLHAVQTPSAEVLPAGEISVADTERYRRDERAAAAVRVAGIARAAGLDSGRHDTLIVEGDASACIVEQERNCDLVVMGKQGRSAAKDFLLGSVSRHVLAEANIDVVISTVCGSTT